MINRPNEPWYFRNSVIAIAFICVGALALPLVWFNPRFSVKTKIIVTIISLVVSYFVSIWFLQSFKTIMEYYKQIQL